MMSSLLCIFLMRQRHTIFYATLKCTAFYLDFTPPITSPPPSKSHMAASPPSDRGCMWQIWLRCGIITLRCDITQEGVFWGLDMAWDRPNFLTYVAHLFKLQDLQNSSQTNRLIDQFCWIRLQKNELEMAYFSPFWIKFLGKIVNFRSQIQQLVGDGKSLCQW